MKTQIITGLKFLLLMTFLTGILYPGLVTAIANLCWSKKAHGSMVKVDGTIIGSELIGQNFTDPKYFWSRPSVNNYNTLPSGGSNLGPLNPELKEKINNRKQLLITTNELNDTSAFPPEMLTSSASGLDPHITPEAALLQVKRIAAVRGMTGTGQQQIIEKIAELTEKPQFSMFGESRINVFLLNLALDSLR